LRSAEHRGKGIPVAGEIGLGYWGVRKNPLLHHSSAPIGQSFYRRGFMNDRSRSCASFFSAVIFLLIVVSTVCAQEKIRIAYSSTDTINQVWTVAYDAGFFKKQGLDVDLVYIGSTTVGIAAIVAQDVQVGNAAGSGVANAAVRGADTVSTACMINVLAYELVVLDSIRSPEDLKGKSIGISRFGSVSDVAARELLKGLGLKPMEAVKTLKGGAVSERAAGLSGGVMAGFPSPPGNVNLIPGGLPHRVLADMADLKKPYPLPFICAVTTKSYLAKNRSVVRRVMMALIEASNYFK